MKSVREGKNRRSTSGTGRATRLAACFFVFVMVAAAVPQAAGLTGLGKGWLAAREVYASSIGGITLTNNRYTAEAGSRNVLLSIEIQNSSNNTAQNLTATLRSSKDAVTVREGSQEVRVPTKEGSTNGRNSVDFTVNVGNDADGTYSLELILDNGSMKQTETIYLEIVEKTSSPISSGNYIISTDIDYSLSNKDGIVAGQSTELTLNVYNRSNSLMKGAVASIKLPEGLYINSGSSSQSLGYLSVGDKKTATFTISADEDIESKSYPIDVTIECKDSSNNDTSVYHTIYVPVSGTSAKNYALDNIEIINVSMPDQINQEEECSLRFTVKNSGSKAISDMQVKAEIPEGLINTTRTLFSIDSLEPGASQNFAVTVASTDKTEEQFYAVKLVVESNSDKAKGTTNVTQYTGTFVKASKKSGNEKTPQLMVSSYTYGGIYVQAGDNFTLNLGLLNTSGSDLYNVKVTVSSDDGSFVPLNSASFHLDNIASKGSTSKSISMTSKRDSDEKTSSLTVEMSYEDADGNAFTSKDVISIPIMQDTKLVVDEFSNPRDVMVGNQSRASINFYNMGKTALNNLRVSASGNFTTESSNFQYVGNMQPGVDDSYTFSFIPVEEGTVNGVVTFTYENASGTVISIEKPFEFAVMEMPVWEEDFGDYFPEEESRGTPWKVIGFVAVIAVIIIAALLFKKLRKSKLDKELEIDE